MYDLEYAKQWIKYEESGEDKLRILHLLPFLKDSINNFSKNGSRVLDVGCGWGGALKFVPKFRGFEYVGVDPNPYFLDYARSRYASKNHRKINLVEGGLPSNVPVDNESFDIVLCSMALHLVEDMKTSIETLFSKAKIEGKVVIASFSDAAEKPLRGAFLRVDDESRNYIRGVYRLSKKIKIDGEAYFHKQKDIEPVLQQHGRFDRELLGPLFIGYTIGKVR